MTARVYFIKASVKDGEKAISQKARRLFKAGKLKNCFAEDDFTAIKVHVGEGTNNTYVTAPCIKGLVDELLALNTRPFVTDTNTLYIGRRHNTIDHATLAAEHGFSLDGLGVPFIVADGLFGTSETAVKIKGEINKQVYIAHDLIRCNSILSVAHLTGHPAAYPAATLKTLGMGCASRKGKTKQHAALTLSISKDCTTCGECIEHCPADAITLSKLKAHIDQDKCIGCAECLSVCKSHAVTCNWGKETEVMQKSIAEHALGVLKGKQNKAAFFNFIISVTEGCDCFSSRNMRKVVDDIGIVAATDPVAVDQA
ncbi:MAG: DUF362 domain-containing protein, partial [Planctomycetota bacterium]